MTSQLASIFRLTFVSFLLNFFMAIAKFILGYLGHSYALIADGIESTGDVFSSFLVLLGLRFAVQPPDENHPYGHGRLEPLITFIVVGVLVASATVIAYESVLHGFSSHEAPKPWVLGVLGIIIVCKEVISRVLLRKAKSVSSTVLQAEAWHHRSDAITSFVVFLGILIAIFGGPRFVFMDDVAAFIASGFILYNSYLIFRPALGEIMDEHTHDELIAQIRHLSLEVPGVLETEKCFVRKLGMTYVVDLHAVVNGALTVFEGHDIAHRIKDKICLELPQIRDVLIHIEPS